MSCLLCKAGCAHCRCEQAWSEVQHLAVGYGAEVRDGAEAIGMVADMTDELYKQSVAIEEKGPGASEGELETHRDLIDRYCDLTGLRERLYALINAGVLQWRR